MYNSLKKWCRCRESNPNTGCPVRDFKSNARIVSPTSYHAVSSLSSFSFNHKAYLSKLVSAGAGWCRNNPVRHIYGHILHFIVSAAIGAMVMLSATVYAGDAGSWRKRSNNESGIIIYDESAAKKPDYTWTSLDTALELTYLTLRVIDRNQTIEIARHPERYTENNRILGSHPSISEVNRYMLLLAVTHPIISYKLPRPLRTVWQGVTIVEVGNAVYGNHRLGIAYTLHY